ncbi:hypothetical protein FRB99_004331 [Tulasnella sp. 403]|nr:hypothetical protein FRB99_004331 [Tulasnella sp. 403]
MLRNRIQTFTPSEPSSPLSASSDAVLSASSQDDRLLPSRPIRFTTSPQTSRHNAVSRADEALQDTSEADTAGWDTDEELEYQLNQIAALKLSNNLTSLTTPQSQAPQRFSRALRLVALGLVLTVLLK